VNYNLVTAQLALPTISTLASWVGSQLISVKEHDMTPQPNSSPAGNVPGNPPFRRGDHLRAGKPGSPHHDGIYVGDNRVIHMTGGEGGGKAGARIRIDSVAVFANGRPVTVRPYADRHDPDAIIARATSKLGEGGYHLVFNNCQHFARWCATGDHHSEQVTSVAATAGTVGVPVVAVTAGFSIIGSAGLVSGLSGPGIMSGLAAYGTLVGGGAVAGLVVLGATPSLATVAIMSKALNKDDDLPQPEQNARTAGRVGSAAGAVAGSIGSVAAVSAVGVPGLSAVGISSGLATIGSAVTGGGMAAGALTVIAAPAIAAAVTGYLIYRIVRWLNDQAPSPAPA
jgi:hypothetical protein